MSISLLTAKLTLGALMAAFALAEWLAGRFGKDARPGDAWADLVSFVVVPAVVLVTVLGVAETLTGLAAPQLAGVARDWPVWLLFGLLLLGDDLTQYLWHRAAHTVPGLYALHRSHHSAPYLSVRITYRNSLLYYVFMPSLWIVGVLRYVGFDEVYPVYLVAKMTVIIGAHSAVPWDAPLYRNRLTRPLMWVVERVISTPSTHSMHHGLHAQDGVTHYKGNFGNFLFLWDVLFGTAVITRRRPDGFGIEKLEPLPPLREVLWPWPAKR